jgi:predicted RNA binding protein YcfA (HicA-like mRNA interferase family)
MSSWKKLLSQMANDPKPVGYSYWDCARVLERLGYTCRTSSGSHRHWRRRRDDNSFSPVGLVDKGRGTIPREYVQDMIKELRAEGLLEESPDDTHS